MARFEFERSGSYVNLRFHYPICAKACSKSSMRSSAFSSPSEMRSSVGVTPAAVRSASLNCLWVVYAGWVTTVIESPIMVMLAARRSDSTKRTVLSSVPLSSTVKTADEP